MTTLPPADTRPDVPLVDDTTAVEALHERIRELEHALTLDVSGKVVVVTVEPSVPPGDHLGALAERLRDAGAALVIVVPEGIAALEVVDEATMAERGWQRIEGFATKPEPTR